MSREDWRVEQIKTVRNLCDISMLLIELGKPNLLPTCLEYMFEECQKLLDAHCVEREKKP